MLTLDDDYRPVVLPPNAQARLRDLLRGHGVTVTDDEEVGIASDAEASGCGNGTCDWTDLTIRVYVIGAAHRRHDYGATSQPGFDPFASFMRDLFPADGTTRTDADANLLAENARLRSRAERADARAHQRQDRLDAVRRALGG